jgi:thioredoxin reductase (NADPH)
MTYDVIIIGAGPAGLAAAIYASRARLKTLLIESQTVPGQAVITNDIENYPGFPGVLRGFDLMERFRKQAGGFGAEFRSGHAQRITEHKQWGKKAREVDLGKEKIVALSVIVASGARPKKLGVSGEDKFRGKGVSYCAVCDAAFFKGKNVVVVGGGDTAIEEAIFLAKFAERVTVIHRRGSLRATKILQERAFANKKLKFMWDSTVIGISGSDKVNAVRVRNLKNEKETDFACEGVFLFIGYTPNTGFLRGVLDLDERGYVIADDEMRTSEEGIFVAGDARKKLLRQIVTASGDGATAAFSARLYVEELKGVAYK